MQKRNAMIQIMRLVFAVVIVLLHSNYLTDDPAAVGTPFLRAHTAVEFFFFVSGYFLAARACRSTSDEPLAAETWRYVFRKFGRILPYLIVSVGMAGVLYGVEAGLSASELIGLFTNAAFEVTMVGSSGLFFGYLNGPTWYLSSLFLGTIALYPLCRRYRQTFTGVIAPLAAILIGGWINVRWGYLELVIYPAALLRGIMGMCIGCTVYYLSERIAGKTYTRAQRTALTVLELGCYLAALALMYRPHEADWDFRVMLLLTVATAVSLLGVSYTADIPYRNWCDYAGTASLLLYLNHSKWGTLLKAWFPGVSYWRLLPVYLACAFVGMTVCYGLSRLLMWLWRACRAKLAAGKTAQAG